MSKEIQVVAIGNAFELVFEHRIPYSNLTNLARSDENHFGQKAGFWTTRHGFPKITICTSSPSKQVLDTIYEKTPPPTFIEPQRKSSSICFDLLSDQIAIRTLLSLLDSSKPVFLAPYVHTREFEKLAQFLIESGFDLVDCQIQADLVKRLWNKTEAKHIIFDPVKNLNEHRPKSFIADSDKSLMGILKHCSEHEINSVVVKSSSAVGGSGVFYVDTADISENTTISRLLRGSGQNEPNRMAPFIIEERVDWDISPTIDIDISASGQIHFVGVALQRLHDRRYYNGFYASPTFLNSWWFADIYSLAKEIGLRMSALGYQGPANIDFVVSFEKNRITLIEVNPRRSALIDGYGIRELRYDSNADISISAVDYVNVSKTFENLESVFKKLSEDAPTPEEILVVSDGGFSSNYRWLGILAFGVYPVDSEDSLSDVVSMLQDSRRDETGVATEAVRKYDKISHESA